MRILGLDLSLRSTGYVVLDEDEVVWHGGVGSRDLREVERLAMFDTWIRETLSSKNAIYWTQHPAPDAPRPAYTPIDHVAIEGYSYASANMLPALGELGGVIKLAVHQAGIPIHVIAPGTWKKVLCGNGQLKKDQVRLEIYKRYAVEFASQDTTDAWAVAMCRRRQLLGLDKPEPKTRSRKVSARNQPQLNIPATEEAHDEARETSTRRPAGTAPASSLASG